MNKRSRRPSDPWRVLTLVIVIAGLVYLNGVVIPKSPALFMPTATPTRSPESFLNEADQLYKSGKVIQAIVVYKQAILAAPNNQSIYIALAQAQIYSGEYQDALTSAERSLVGNDNYAMGHAMRGWALNFLEKYDEAEASLERALELDPNNALAHAAYAEVLINREGYGDLDKAITESKKALDLEPTGLEALRARGYVLYNTGNYKESLDMYQAAIGINKNLPDLYLYTAYNYQALSVENGSQDDLDKAIASFLQAKSLNPKDPIPDLELSRIFAQLGEFEKAIQYAENAVRADPENPLRYGNLGYMYYRKEDYNQSILYLSLAIHGGTTKDGVVVKGRPLDTDMAKYYWFYGFALAKVTPNRCGEAIPVFQALLTGVPDNQLAVDNATEGMKLCQANAANPANSEPTATAEP